VRHPVNAQVHTGTYRFVRVRHADQKADLWSGGNGTDRVTGVPTETRHNANTRTLCRKTACMSYPALRPP